jgi:hypothetical protein
MLQIPVPILRMVPFPGMYQSVPVPFQTLRRNIHGLSITFLRHTTSISTGTFPSYVMPISSTLPFSVLLSRCACLRTLPQFPHHDKAVKSFHTPLPASSLSLPVLGVPRLLMP